MASLVYLCMFVFVVCLFFFLLNKAAPKYVGHSVLLDSGLDGASDRTDCLCLFSGMMELFNASFKFFFSAFRGPRTCSPSPFEASLLALAACVVCRLVGIIR